MKKEELNATAQQSRLRLQTQDPGQKFYCVAELSLASCGETSCLVRAGFVIIVSGVIGLSRDKNGFFVYGMLRLETWKQCLIESDYKLHK